MGRWGGIAIWALIGISAASVLGLTADEILRSVYDSATTALRTNLVSGGGTVSSDTSLTIENGGFVRWSEEEENGTDYVNVRAPASLAAIRSCTLEDTAYPFDGCVSPFVEGPASAQAGTIPLYDGGTGKLLKSSVVSIDVSGNLTTAGTVSAGGSGAGQITWKEADASGTNKIDVIAPALAADRSCTLEDDATPFDGCISSILRTRQILYARGTDSGSVLVDGDDQPTIYANRFGQGITITEVWCESDAGTPSINIQRDDGSPADVLSSNLSCSTSGATGTIDTNEDNVADGNKLDFVMVAAGGVAKRVTVAIKATLD